MYKHLRSALMAASVLAFILGLGVWLTLYRVVPQPEWVTGDQRNNYLYGAVGTSKTEGIPYWIWLAMPRMFPEYMPGPGGYAALGMSWEEGEEMPVGFAKQRVGYIRVTGNCALCHALSQPHGQDRTPTIIPVSKSNTTDLQPLVNFYRRSAQDPRFNADEFFSEINTDTKLSWFDNLFYRYVLIPRMRRVLIDDPESVIFDSALRIHASQPHAESPLSDPQKKGIEMWMNGQIQAVKPEP